MVDLMILLSFVLLFVYLGMANRRHNFRSLSYIRLELDVVERVLSKAAY